MSDMETRIANDDDQAEIFEMVEALRAAVVPILAPDIAHIDPNRMAKMIAAAGIFAGIQFGTLIAMGIASDKDQSRVNSIVSSNFRKGIDIGKQHAVRAAEIVAGGIGHA